MEYNDLEKIRLAKIQRLLDQGIPPFPTRANPTHTIQAARLAFEASEASLKTPSAGTSAGSQDSVQASLAGRLRAMRPMGKLTFAHIEDGTGRIQLFFRINELGDDAMRRFTEDYDLGDFIEASGSLFRTRTGEVTLQVRRARGWTGGPPRHPGRP
jgi:lysyl-tRNA synthetase class 2